MEEKSLYCLGIHFKCLYEQSVDAREPDIVEPCRICRYSKDCNPNYWFEMQNDLKHETGIVVRPYRNFDKDA